MLFTMLGSCIKSKDIAPAHQSNTGYLKLAVHADMQLLLGTATQAVSHDANLVHCMQTINIKIRYFPLLRDARGFPLLRDAEKGSPQCLNTARLLICTHVVESRPHLNS